jgi:hypothetical protein
VIIDEIMVVQKQDMQKHVRIPEITCTGYTMQRRRGTVPALRGAAEIAPALQG